MITDQEINQRIFNVKKAIERKNILGSHKVMKSIAKAKENEDKLDHIVLLEIGLYLSEKNIGEIEFEKKLTKPTPHDIVLDFRGSLIVIEVRRIRESARHRSLKEQLEIPEKRKLEIISQTKELEILDTDDFIEIQDQGEFKKLISKIIDDKYRQLEEGYSNIIFIVSGDNLLYRADNIQDACKEICRYNKVGNLMYENLAALFYAEENSINIIRKHLVFKNDVAQALISKLNEIETT